MFHLTWLFMTFGDFLLFMIIGDKIWRLTIPNHGKSPSNQGSNQWKWHFVGSQTDTPKRHTLIRILPPANVYTKLCLHSSKEKIRWLDKSRAHNLRVITKDNTWLEQLEFQWVVSNYSPWRTIWGENAPIWVSTGVPAGNPILGHNILGHFCPTLGHFLYILGHFSGNKWHWGDFIGGWLPPHSPESTVIST